jgi:hypothetical protein
VLFDIVGRDRTESSWRHAVMARHIRLYSQAVEAAPVPVIVARQQK